MKEFRLDGEIAIVTGSAQGIGRGIALALARSGVEVALMDISDKINEVVQAVKDSGSSGLALKCDVASYKEVQEASEKVFEKYGRVDILVNNAGIQRAQPVIGPKEIRELLAFSPRNFGVQQSDEDQDVNSPRFGLPLYYTIRRGSCGTQVKLHYTRAIHFATRLLDHAYEGMSTLEPVYDDLTILRNIRWGMGQTLYRQGSGFPDVTIEGAKRKDLEDLEASQQFKSLQARTYFLHNEKTTLDFKGAAGKALNPEPYYLAIMENISAGCGIPLALLRGAQAGALTGSEVNEWEYFKLVSDAQSKYEPGIRELIDRLIECGMIRYKWNVNRGYRIRWLGGFELNEKDKAEGVQRT